MLVSHRFGPERVKLPIFREIIPSRLIPKFTGFRGTAKQESVSSSPSNISASATPTTGPPEVETDLTKVPDGEIRYYHVEDTHDTYSYGGYAYQGCRHRGRIYFKCIISVSSDDNITIRVIDKFGIPWRTLYNRKNTEIDFLDGTDVVCVNETDTPQDVINFFYVAPISSYKNVEGGTDIRNANIGEIWYEYGIDTNPFVVNRDKSGMIIQCLKVYKIKIDRLDPGTIYTSANHYVREDIAPEEITGVDLNWMWGAKICYDEDKTVKNINEVIENINKKIEQNIKSKTTTGGKPKKHTRKHKRNRKTHKRSRKSGKRNKKTNKRR